MTALVTEGQELSKKALSRLDKERKRLEKNLSGIQEMGKLPDAIFIIDANREEIAVHEARKLGIPVIAIVDTNCDPDVVDFVIPGNDDALRAIKLFTSRIADAVIAGRDMSKAATPEAPPPAAEASGSDDNEPETETSASSAGDGGESSSDEAPSVTTPPPA